VSLPSPEELAALGYVPVTTGNMAVSYGDRNDHRACDAEIARLRAENERLRAEIREHGGWPILPPRDSGEGGGS
jgi:hypothetical protein